jgi:hypothetical protein
MTFLEKVKGKHSGQNVYIVAKGTSLNFLTKELIGEGIVITLNQAIEKVESLNLPNTIYSMQKDRIVSMISDKNTLLLQTGYSANEGKEIKGLIYEEFATEDLGLAHDAFSAIAAIRLGLWMGCSYFYLISFDSCTNGDLKTFDGSKPYFENAYVSQKHRMKPYLEEIKYEFITPKQEIEIKEILAPKENSVIALITPTGGRRKQIQLCAKWMKAQTYKGKVLWIIVDDCEPKTTEFIPKDFRENWEIVHIHPTPVWRPGQNTQSRNLQAGIDEVKKRSDIQAIFIIEDDDYYKPEYLLYMLAFFTGNDLCGEIQTLYCNVELLLYRRCLNARHCSLFQVMFSPKAIPIFEDVLSKNVKFIDIEFFKNANEANLKIGTFKGLDLAVGIKGLPGRKGIGSGHQLDIYKPREQKRTRQERILELKNLIGDDYKFYIQ